MLSVPLVLEYEAVATRESRAMGLTRADIGSVLDYLCKVGVHREIHFLWRTILRDPDDEMILELAVESQADFIVTHNRGDFERVTDFGIEAVTPREFLARIGETS